jgi:WD40 repeat protein
MAASADGRRIVVGCNADEPEPGAGGGRANAVFPEPPFDLLVIDTTTGERREVESHGHDIAAIAVDPSGELLATRDTSGVVRVGRIDGSEPHLLVGAGGLVGSLAFSPDGRWIASAAGNDIRLWPMPDVSKPPLHTLPRETLLATLDRLTNLRVIADAAAPAGYKVELGPFPGWQDVPAW